MFSDLARYRELRSSAFQELTQCCEPYEPPDDPDVGGCMKAGPPICTMPNFDPNSSMA
eukprot:CAMPEP_0181292582 /NCGR_PEP_ID=MMETSP1101-20121128/2587_1 /TAXON_ID=46948 /ORGANISM="Rhodomonas abbreviata, Strain Caron Lab Isolate" /LENGTH=57 /DNA_ID=CAMNT_0023397069 /DNA_START=23 /DNA_END=196 /DNA_ORIENTATION=+